MKADYVSLQVEAWSGRSYKEVTYGETHLSLPSDNRQTDAAHRRTRQPRSTWQGATKHRVSTKQAPTRR